MQPRKYFTWRGVRRVSKRGKRVAASAIRAPKHPTVQVSLRAYANLTERALEYGVTNKALLEYLLRDLPRLPNRYEVARAVARRQR